MNLSTVAPCFVRDRRHLGEILVQQRGQVFRLQALGGGGEILDVGEEDRQPLALGRDLHVALPGEDALVDLRRDIFGDLHRDGGEKVVRLRQFLVDAADLLGLISLQAE